MQDCPVPRLPERVERAARRKSLRSGLHSSTGAAGARSTVHRIPRISFFYGIAIFMYFNEGIHAIPHFHARYAGTAASVDLDGNLIAGSLPPRAHSLVADWTTLHRDELLAN
jgi:hypothetical protein